MSAQQRPQCLTAILPVTNITSAQSFFERLGFVRIEGSPDDYVMMKDENSGEIHLRLLEADEKHCLKPKENPFGLYLYRKDVDALAQTFRRDIIEKEGPSKKSWGMYEFAVNGPNDVLVRVGWPASASSE